MKLQPSSLLVAAMAAVGTTQAFVPPTALPTQAARALATRRMSVRLPTPPEAADMQRQLMQQEQREEELELMGAADVPAALHEAATMAPAAADEAGAAASSSSSKGTKRKGPAPVVVLEDDILESTWEHRLLVGTHYAVSVAALAQIAQGYAAQGGVGPTDAAALAAVTAFSVLFSDAFSGVFHWSVDNYGDGSTPVMGGVIAAFQGHHDAPWTITYRSFANNVHKITKITIPAMLALVALGHVDSHPLLGLFATLFFNLQVLSQEFHKLSHLSKPPAWAAALQDAGLIISRKEHGGHHTSPFEGNYCILTGTCNKFLDESGFFRRLERIVYELTGAEPNCWKLGPEIKAQALRSTDMD